MEYITPLLIACAIAAGLFFLFRNINLWYFRIDEGISKMDKQIELLEEIKKLLAQGQFQNKENEKQPDSKTDNKVENFIKSGNNYRLTNGINYTMAKDGDYFYFEYGEKKYYYADLISAENSLNEMGIGTEPSKKDLISIKNK